MVGDAVGAAVILHVRRAAHYITDIEVPDKATATQAAAIVAYECGLSGLVMLKEQQGFPVPWKICYGITQRGPHEHMQFLHLDQTVDDLPDTGAPIFLISEGGSQWN